MGRKTSPGSRGSFCKKQYYHKTNTQFNNGIKLGSMRLECTLLRIASLMKKNSAVDTIPARRGEITHDETETRARW